jgi:hypothetical protein
MAAKTPRAVVQDQVRNLRKNATDAKVADEMLSQAMRATDAANRATDKGDEQELARQREFAKLYAQACNELRGKEAATDLTRRR